MPVIHLPFPKSLSSVSVTRGSVQAPTPKVPDGPAEDPSAESGEDASRQSALATLASINEKLQRINATRQAEMSTIGAQLVAAAKQIARDALGSENSLIDERVTHFADVLIRQIHPKQPAVFFVNPDSVPAMKTWLDQTERGDFQIQADTTVPAGDCRIELNDKGFLASLESILDAAGKRTTLARGEV